MPSVFCERGEVSRDNIRPRQTNRETASHPGCPRQWCSLCPEPHQSPIRIKASERARGTDQLQPLARRAPDNRRFSVASIVTTHRMLGYQRAGANPILAHHRGVSVPTLRGAGENRVETAANRECGVAPHPLCELSVPPLIGSQSAEGA